MPLKYDPFLTSFVVIVSMSALWNINHAYHLNNVTIPAFMELRTIPAIFTVPSISAALGSQASLESNVQGVLTNVYGLLSSDWLYGVSAAPFPLSSKKSNFLQGNCRRRV